MASTTSYQSDSSSLRRSSALSGIARTPSISASLTLNSRHGALSGGRELRLLARERSSGGCRWPGTVLPRRLVRPELELHDHAGVVARLSQLDQRLPRLELEPGDGYPPPRRAVYPDHSPRRAIHLEAQRGARSNVVELDLERRRGVAHFDGPAVAGDRQVVSADLSRLRRS